MRYTPALLVVLVLLAVPVAAHTNHVSADTQVSTDGTVVVEAIYPADGVWVAVHLDDDGEPGAVVGARQVAGGSFHADVPVAIDDETWANWTGSQRLHVVLHRPNGDGQFDPETDEPLSSFGDPVTDELTLQKGPTARVTAESFGPEKTTESAITLRSAVLPDDGYVVLRNASADGAVVGHVALDAGTHDAVRVDFEDSFYHDQPEQFQLAASIVIDDGDGELDADDERLTVGTEPVGTTIGVQKASSDEHDHGAETTASTAGTTTATRTTSPSSPSDTTATLANDSRTTPETPDSSGSPGFSITAAIAALLALFAGWRYRSPRP